MTVRLQDLMDQNTSLLKHWKWQNQLCLLLSLSYHQKVQRVSVVRELIVNMFCVLLKLFCSFFIILVIVGKLLIARCNRKLENMETCIEQLKEMRNVEGANMPDSRSNVCRGQYSSVSVNVFVLQ